MNRTSFLRAGLALCAVLACGLAAADDGFVPIFDGKTLNGWDGDPQFWRVEDGLITGETTKDKPAKYNTFLVYRGGEVADFECTFEYRFQSDWGNSGLQYRSFEVPEKKWAIGGYQADFDAKNGYTGIVYGERFRGILSKRGEKTVLDTGEKGKLKVKSAEKFADNAELAKGIKINEWNSYRVVAKGFRFTQEINGKLMTDLTDDDMNARKASGLLALQLHAGPPMKVQFRNILLKKLPAGKTAADERPRVRALCLPASAAQASVQLTAAKSEGVRKKVVFLAGRPSHGYMQHEHNAGCLLLAKLIDENVPQIQTTVVRSEGKQHGWPGDPKVLEEADAIVIFSDGGGGHPAMPHLDEVDKLMKKGVGLACLHYAVEIPKGDPGNKLLSWIGGYYETFWSVNPHWTAEYKTFPDHPVARGLKPFTVDDEWYYHMRFPDDMKGVTPILTTVPPDATHRPGNDAHGANPVVFARKGMPEHLAWTYERPGGGRGFGFTGGHWHYNWANESFRKVVLNAIVWVAGLDVPQGGVPSKTPTLDELKANLDPKNQKGFDPLKVQKILDDWKKE